jgi:hemoglobin/transferrin/lactoferrin receptor protein
MKSMYITCFAFMGILSAIAQTAKPDSSVMLDELVISANKIPEMRSKVAQQIQVIDAERIKNLNAQTAADLIINSGVAAVQKSQQGGGSPQLRGFEASRIVLMVDGVRMNNLIYRAGHLQNIITLDNNSLERAEILLGPASTMYGSDALGGVISFRTKDPMVPENGVKLKSAGNTFFRYGTVNEEKTGHLDFSIGSKKFGSFTSFTFSNFGDLRMGEKKNPALGEDFGLRTFYVERSSDNSWDVLVQNADPYLQKFSGYSQYDLVQKFKFRASENISHTLNFQASNSSNIPRYDRLTDPDGTGLRNAEWYYGPQKRLMASYQLAVKGLGVIADNLQATLSYQDVEESRHDRRFQAPGQTNANRVNTRNQIEKVDVIGLTLDLNKSRGASTWRYGFDGQFNSLESTAYYGNVVTGEQSPIATRYPDGRNKMNSMALYFTHTLDISSTLTLNDGIRLGLSTLRSKFEDQTFFPFPFDEVEQKNSYASGNLGLIFRPSHDWKVTLATNTGYRVPNIDDLAKVFETSAGQSLVVPNPDLKPEKTLNFDFTITKVFSDRVRWENAFFYTSFFDAIVTDVFTFNGQSTVDYQGQPTPVMASQNKRRAFITGFSSLIHASLGKSLTADASYNYTRGRITSEADEKPLDHIPPSFGRVSFQYTEKKWSGNVFVNFSGWKRIDDYFMNSEDNEVYATPKGMPSWYTINFRAGYSFNRNLSLQAGVDNLLDMQYRTFSSGINAPGRNFFVVMRAGF